MGMRASFTEISPQAFEEIARGGEPDVSKGNQHFIDKAWYEFDKVFQRLGPPLSLAIAGDCLHPQRPQSFGEWHEFYAGFMSPKLVREIAKALSALTLPQLQQWYTELGIGGYDRDLRLFANLKVAYVEAADHGNSLMIFIA